MLTTKEVKQIKLKPPLFVEIISHEGMIRNKLDGRLFRDFESASEAMHTHGRIMANNDPQCRKYYSLKCDFRAYWGDEWDYKGSWECSTDMADETIATHIVRYLEFHTGNFADSMSEDDYTRFLAVYGANIDRAELERWKEQIYDLEEK